MLTPMSVSSSLIMMGLISAFYFRKQFLISLLSLELVVLGLFFGVILHMAVSGKMFSLAFYILVLGVCEASIGLSLLVNMTRLSGSDMLSLVGIVKC